MTPLERAENAIRSTLASNYGVTIGGSEPILSRAVLTAIREPSGAMRSDGELGLDSDCTFGCNAEAVWKNMIDAALAEEPQ